MVTSLVSPAVKDAEQEPNIDAPRPRREPKPTKKKLEDLEKTEQCEEPKEERPEKSPEQRKVMITKSLQVSKHKWTTNQRYLKKRRVCLRKGRLLTLKIPRIVDFFQQQILKGCRIYWSEGSM